jgi:hypothetical protein
MLASFLIRPSLLYWLLPFAGAYGVQLLRQKFRNTTAKRWPTVEGIVEYACPRLLDDDEGGGWVGELSYSFSVAGEYYSGFHRIAATGENSATLLVEGWKGQKVAIRYSPRDPSKSALLLEDQEFDSAEDERDSGA